MARGIPPHRSEANDLALDICQMVTGGTETLVLDGAYHGHTQSLLSLSSYKMKQQLSTSSGRIKPSPNVWVVCIYVEHPHK